VRGGTAGPEFVEDVNEMEGVLRFVETEIGGPSGVVAIVHGEAKMACVKILVAQAHRGLLHQAVQHGEGGGGLALLGWENLTVADSAGRWRGTSLHAAVEPVVKTRALDAAPDGAQLSATRGVELGDIGDAGGAEALLHVFADAGKVAELHAALDEFSGNIGVVEEHEPVGFLDIGGELGEKPIRPDAD
jgi:hypothetical protein